MNSTNWKSKPNLLFIILGGFFLTNAIIAEFIGVKIFSLEKLFDAEPVNWNFLGFDDLSFNLTAGVLLWPIVFIMTDVVNEYYGKKGVKILSFLAVGMISYAYLAILLSIQLPASDFWEVQEFSEGSINMDLAFKYVFGQGLWIIIGSLVAFLVGQLIDVTVFQWIRKFTGPSKIWLRATGSTLVGQLIDSFVVLYIAFYIGADWELNLVLAIATINYIYKCLIAILLTPVLYLVHYIIDFYLGKELSLEMTKAASD